MSMKRAGLLTAMMALAAIGGGEPMGMRRRDASIGTGVNPNDHRNGAQKTNEKNWVVNGIHVVAVTKKAAIKKAQKDPNWPTWRTDISAEQI